MASLNPKIFRAYDIRGVAEEYLSPPVVLNIAHAIAEQLKEHGATHVAVGRDVRPSSPRIAQVLMEVFQGAGLEVVDIGVAATPMLYYAVSRYGFGGGVIVTASHNPAPDNGMKILRGDVALSGDDIQDLRARASRGVRVEAPGGSYRTLEILTPYIDAMVADARMGNKKLKIAIDAGNGMSGPSITALLDRLGIDYLPLYCDPDGRFPNHHPDPTQEENLKDLRELVLRENCDFGIGFDGDGDRIGVVDEQARILHGDRLLMIYARDILAEAPGAKIVGEVKCSEVLFEMITAWGGKPILSRVGHSFIKKTLREEEALLAGEMSGHIFFRHRYYGFDDATYAALRLLEIASKQSPEANFSDLLKDVPNPVSTPEIRVHCSDEQKFGVVEKVCAHFRQRHEVNDLDGVRMRFELGWGLVRASNTEPSLVMRFEAENSEALSQYQTEVTEYVQRMIKLS